MHQNISVINTNKGTDRLESVPHSHKLNNMTVGEVLSELFSHRGRMQLASDGPS